MIVDKKLVKRTAWVGWAGEVVQQMDYLNASDLGLFHSIPITLTIGHREYAVAEVHYSDADVLTAVDYESGTDKLRVYWCG